MICVVSSTKDDEERMISCRISLRCEAHVRRRFVGKCLRGNLFRSRDVRKLSQLTVQRVYVGRTSLTVHERTSSTSAYWNCREWKRYHRLDPIEREPYRPLVSPWVLLLSVRARFGFCVFRARRNFVREYRTKETIKCRMKKCPSEKVCSEFIDTAEKYFGAT